MFLARLPYQTTSPHTCAPVVSYIAVLRHGTLYVIVM